MSEKELVIARYEEDLRWVLDVPDDVRVTVYSKSRRPLVGDVMSRIDKIERTPNVGREGHTYLTHIVDNYNSLAKITAFVQGRPRDHGFGVRWDKYFGLSKDTCSSCMKLATVASSCTHTNWDHLTRLRQSRRWADVTWSPLSLTDWWAKYISKDIPTKSDFRCAWGGCFSVTDLYVQTHTKKYYRKLLATLSNSANPEEGHFLERAWAYIFPPTDCEA